jgi:hypothetical protein
MAWHLVKPRDRCILPTVLRFQKLQKVMDFSVLRVSHVDFLLSLKRSLTEFSVRSVI